MGVLLYLASVILGIILVPVGVIYGMIRSFYDTHIGNAFRIANLKFRRMAIGTDVFGNVYCAELFNDTLIKTGEVHRFGEFGVTISAVLGHNLLHENLTRTGRLVVHLLTEDHCINAYIDYLKKNHLEEPGLTEKVKLIN